jgi:hypothetical protein
MLQIMPLSTQNLDSDAVDESCSRRSGQPKIMSIQPKQTNERQTAPRPV